MLRCAECQRGPTVGSQHIDATAMVNALGIGVPPSTLRYIDYTWQDALGQAGVYDQLSSFIPDAVLNRHR